MTIRDWRKLGGLPRSAARLIFSVVLSAYTLLLIDNEGLANLTFETAMNALSMTAKKRGPGWPPGDRPRRSRYFEFVGVLMT